MMVEVFAERIASHAVRDFSRTVDLMPTFGMLIHSRVAVAPRVLAVGARGRIFGGCAKPVVLHT